MRYGIISDIHGNLEALEAALDALSGEKLDKYLCVGDIVGYGANPRECIKRTQALRAVCVCGNHDKASSGGLDPARFNESARRSVMWTRRALGEHHKEFLRGLDPVYEDANLVLAHGTLQEPEKFYYMLDSLDARGTFKRLKKKVCFVGHTHVPGIFLLKGRRIDYSSRRRTLLSAGEKAIVNVGSVGQPRDGDPRACYSVYDSENGSVSLKRLSYDIHKAQRKILDAGLPSFLAQRLKMGM